MKIPRRFMVGPHEWKVKMVPGLMDLANDYGQCNFSRREILIDAGLKGANLRDTFLHECIHAVGEMSMLGLTEQQVTILGTGLAGILK